MEFKTNWGKETYARMLASAMAKPHITVFCRRLTLADRTDCKEPWAEDVLQLNSDLDRLRPMVPEDLFKSGIAMLRSIAFTPTGALRKTEDAGEFSDFSIHVLNTAERILWLDNSGVYGAYGKPRFDPVFRVQNSKEFFDFIKRPWQAGGYFEISKNGYL